MKKSRLNLVKITTLAVVIGLGVSAKAQHSVGDIGTQNSVAYGSSTTGSVKVVDSKGTIKYLQVQNGITMVTNTDPTKGLTTTTWQLGGTLTDDTYIDNNKHSFALDGLELVTNLTASPASVNAKSKTVHKTGTAGTDETVSAESGWTVLIRDEESGEIKKIQLGDLLNVVAGHKVITVGTGKPIVAGSGAQSIDVGFSSTTSKLDVQKVTVFRNGIKLLGAADNSVQSIAANTDYVVDNTNASTLNYVAFNPATSNDDWQFYDGDMVEINWVR